MSTCVLTIQPSVKSSLQKVVLKRLQSAKGTVDLKSLWERKAKQYELSEYELAKVAARKNQNRKAAKKCRERFRNRIEKLEEESAKLVLENEKLLSEIKKFKGEALEIKQEQSDVVNT